MIPKFKHRRAAAPPAAAAVATPEDPHAEARRLLALLENRGDPKDLGADSPDKLRAMAAELIRRVETGHRASPRPAPAPTSASADAPAPSDPPPTFRHKAERRIFKAPPLADPAPAPRPAAPDPAPAPRAATPPSVPRPVLKAPASIANLVQAAKLGGGLTAEHPAIVALALKGSAPRDQAQALRAMPGRQARAVQRLLRP